MRRKILAAVFAAALMMALAIPMFGGAAYADHNVGPCNDSGEPGNSDYAKHHIVPAVIGAGGHIPGGHHGFSVCLS